MTTRDDNVTPLDPPAADDAEQPMVAPLRGYERRQRQAFKDALMVAFHRLGGVEFLVRFGQENPGEFARLCAKLIPQEIRAHQTGEIAVVHVLPPPHGYKLPPGHRLMEAEQARRLGYIDDENDVDARPVGRDADFDTFP